MAAHAYLKNDFTEDKKCQNLMSWLIYVFQIFGGSRDIKFTVWDIEGSEEYTLIHHSVYTEYSLYLLVWDFWSIEKEISDIACWLYNIQVNFIATKEA